MTSVGTVSLDVEFDTGKIARDLGAAAGAAAKPAAAQLKGTLEGQLRSSGKSMQEFGKGVTTNVTLPVAGFGTAALKAFTGYEASMAKISGLSGVAREQVQAWDADVKQIGVDYGVGAQAAADAMYFITSSGIKGAAAVDTLRQSAKASASGLGEVETVADLTTSALNAYATSGLTATRATDVLAAAVAAGKAEPEELAGALGKVLPIASELGVSFDQVAGATAAMTLTGSDAFEATTQLRGIMKALLDPSQQAETALAGVGLSSAGLRDQIRKEGLLSTLQTLTDTLGDDAAATALVFEDTRALTGAMSLFGENAEQTRKVLDQTSTSTGSLDRAFESASETTELKLDRALAQAKKGLIELGAQVAPVAGSVAGGLGSMAEGFGKLPGPVQTTTLTVLGVAAAAGPAAFALGKLASGAGIVLGAAKSLGNRLIDTSSAVRTIGMTSETAAAQATTGMSRMTGALSGAAVVAAGAAASWAIWNAKLSEARPLIDGIAGSARAGFLKDETVEDAEGRLTRINAQLADVRENTKGINPLDADYRSAMRDAAGELDRARIAGAGFLNQARGIATETGANVDEVYRWITAQAAQEKKFGSVSEAVAAWNDHLRGTAAATGVASSQTQQLTAAVGPLADPFFAAIGAQRSYDQSLRGVVAAQHQETQAARGVVEAERSHEEALRKVTAAGEQHRQSLRAVEDAQRGVAEAQRALNEALSGPSTDDQLSLESADLSVERARRRLAELGKATPGEKAEPVDPLDQREAELALRRAENDLLRTREEASGRVATATEGLRDAEDRLTNARTSADTAALSVADANRQVGNAFLGIGEAHQVAVDATTAVKDAEWQAADAARELAATQEQFATSLTRGGALAGPFVTHLTQLRDRYPEVAGGLQAYIDKFSELERMQGHQGWDSQSPRPSDGSPWSPDSLDKRAFGGPVSAGRGYEVNERGAPELFSDGDRQYLLPVVDGSVSPLQVAEFDPAAGGGGGPALVIEHLDVHGPDPVATARRTVIDMSKKAIMATAR